MDLREAGRHRHRMLPDGSERFLMDEAMLIQAAERLGGTWIEPLIVQNQRSTTWVLRKHP